jgi:hypothetical protein
MNNQVKGIRWAKDYLIPARSNVTSVPPGRRIANHFQQNEPW